MEPRLTLNRSPFASEPPRRPDPADPRWPGGPDRPGGRPPGPPPPGGIAPWLEERLFDQRIVVLQGHLDEPLATRTAAALLSLDALGADPVRLHMATPDATLDAAFALIDTVDAMRAPVHPVATAQVGGAAVGVFAIGRRRLAYPHARFRLGEPRVDGLAGTADQVAAAAGRHLQALEDLVVRVAEATGQPRSRVEDDFASGRVLTAPQAQEYGLVDEVSRA